MLGLCLAARRALLRDPADHLLEGQQQHHGRDRSDQPGHIGHAGHAQASQPGTVRPRSFAPRVRCRTDAADGACHTVGMNPPAESAPAPQAFFHEDSGAVRCWVPMPDGGSMGAIVRKELLHHGFGGRIDGSDALDTFHAHRGAIEAAVRRRVAAGATEPVLLREADLRPPAA